MGDQAQVDSSDNFPSLTNDLVFKNLYNAFQLGWSIIELKSRIQIASPGTIPNDAKPSVSTTESDNSSQGQASQKSPKALLTILDATEQLRSLKSQPDPTALPDSAWLTSLWRATFNRIVESHKCCFPKGTTTGSLYNIPSPLSASNYQAMINNPQNYNASSMYLPYVYLNPPVSKNYSDVGIQFDKDMPDNFTLYDVTRRTFNCLTLLCTNPEESLIPETVKDFQEQLMQNVLTYDHLAEAINKNAQSGQTQIAPTTSDQLMVPQGDQTPTYQTSTASVIAGPDQKSDAIKLLSINAIRLLEAWDTYARETLYVSGGEVVQTNSIQLVAYEAGRAMASLSWGITTTIVPIENTMSQDDGNVSEQQKRLVQAWQNIFSDRSIASLQQRISALSTAMDDAYYRVHSDISRPNPNEPAERTNLALPSQTIQAITFSLDYWKRGIQLICPKQPDTNTGTPPPGGLSKKDVIPSMNRQTSINLRLALVQQAEIWQPLLLHQQSLLDFTTQYVTQRILNDFMRECEQAASQEIQNEITKFRTPLIIGGGVILFLLVSFVLLFIFFQSSYQALVSGFALLIGGIVGFFGAVAGRLRSIFSPSNGGTTAVQGSASPMSAFPGLAGAALVEAFQNGYKQILVEFDYLNHNVSITYPLVEFFILHSDQLALKIKAHNAQVANTPENNINRNLISQRIATLFNGKNQESLSQKNGNEFTLDPRDLIIDAYSFLTKIVWTNEDRAAEIGRIARAAFGPIGAFIGAQISLSSSQNNKSSAKSK